MLNDPVRRAAATQPAGGGGFGGGGGGGGGRRGTTQPFGRGTTQPTTRAGRGGRGGGGGRGAGGPGGIQLPGAGSIYIGTKGKMLVSGDYSDSMRLLPEAFHVNTPRPAAVVPPSIGHKPEWVAAIRGEKPVDFPGTNFRYSGNETENMLLGAIIQRIGKVGFKIECDAVNRIIKTPEAAALAKREYRAGWGI
jgi:hypothetical protein